MSDTVVATEADENGTIDPTDWKAHARKWEDRAKSSKKEADELRAKVQTYESSLSASETEMEALKSQVSELTAKSAKTEREALVARIARDNGITDSEDIELFLTGADEQALTAQSARLASRYAATNEAASQAAAEAERANAIVPTEGQNLHTPQALDSDQEFASAIAAALGQAQGLAE